MANCTSLDAAVALAHKVDVAIVVLGDGQGDCGEWGDRDSLEPVEINLLVIHRESAREH